MARILIVDDMTELCKSLASVISRDDIHAHCVTSVEEAMKATAARSYDLAVVDAHLGADSGLELVRTLSRTYPKMLFIVISGYSRGHLRMTLNKRVGFLPKPFVPRQLVDCIRDMVARKAA